MNMLIHEVQWSLFSPCQNISSIILALIDNGRLYMHKNIFYVWTPIITTEHILHDAEVNTVSVDLSTWSSDMYIHMYLYFLSWVSERF